MLLSQAAMYGGYICAFVSRKIKWHKNMWAVGPQPRNCPHAFVDNPEALKPQLNLCVYSCAGGKNSSNWDRSWLSCSCCWKIEAYFANILYHEIISCHSFCHVRMSTVFTGALVDSQTAETHAVFAPLWCWQHLHRARRMTESIHRWFITCNVELLSLLAVRTIGSDILVFAVTCSPFWSLICHYASALPFCPRNPVFVKMLLVSQYI